MKRLAYVVAALLGCAVGLQATCRASTITVEVRATTSVSNGAPRLELRFANRGDEPAFDVQAQAHLCNEAITAAELPVLTTDRAHTVTATFDNPPSVPGTYPIILHIAYKDGRGTPFSIVSVFPLRTVPVTGEEPVAVVLSSALLDRSAELSVELATAYTKDIGATLTLVTPNDIECADPVRKLVCPPLENIQARFDVRAGHARPGSSYLVYAVLQYVRDGRHHYTACPGKLRIAAPRTRPLFWPVMLACAALVTAFAVLQRSALHTPPLHTAFDLAVLAVLAGFTAHHIPLALLLTDTLTVGGDTVAHNYLASHLARHLFGGGRVVSWAPGWWCGFPAFQYYFPLPYVLMALLDLLLPFNIAFKLITIGGVFLLPPCAYAAGRLGRFPRPVPVLLAVAALPLLFDRSNTMWGVNIYSTLAGMISNSWSFPVMLLCMGSVLRDLDDLRFRYASVVLLVALFASHFFTSVMAIATVGAMALLRRPSAWPRALWLLARELGLALLLMAWWIVPLIAKRSFSVDFGLNWDVSLAEQMPPFMWCVAAVCLASLYPAFRKQARCVAVFAVLLVGSIALFYVGYDISPVFVNVRLWPFGLYAVLALCAVGVGLALAERRLNEIAVVACLLVALTFGIGKPNTVHDAAAWNYSGLEPKPAAPLFQQLIEPLRGTAGRLANDLHSDNEHFGSSRIFECVPHLVGKPVLEGGIVNSALGSLFAYYVQGETSRSHAGAPPIVKPPSFDPDRATRHLELFNVKHFIARWPGVRSAFAAAPEWRSVRRVEDWELFELLTHDGAYVSVPACAPRAVRTGNWKRIALDWMDIIEWVDCPFVLLRPGQPPPPEAPVLSEAEFKAVRTAGSLQWIPVALPDRRPVVVDERVTDHSIRFRTRAVGAPHIIKMSYFPNWKVRGADRVYMVTPGFMLVYPKREDVELYYGSTLSDNAGRTATILGLGIMAFALARGARRKRAGLEAAGQNTPGIR